MRLTVLLLSVSLATSPAWALTEEQRALATTMGLLSAAAKWCRQYIVDMDGVNRAAGVIGLDTNDPEVNQMVKDAYKSVENGLPDAGVIKTCSSVYDFARETSKREGAGVLMIRK